VKPEKLGQAGASLARETRAEASVMTLMDLADT
jgi:hypothetical protein